MFEEVYKILLALISVVGVSAAIIGIIHYSKEYNKFLNKGK